MESHPTPSKTNTANFYGNLRGFSDFSELNNEAYYTDIPDDWYVIISDIKGSTRAIEEGRYKEVNTLGAASISVLQKALGTFHFPFVFGGDGATALLHESDIERVKMALLGLKSMAKSQFRMNLRVGFVSVRDIYKTDKKIQVAKFFLNPKKSIAMLRGGGLAYADDLIKSDPVTYCLDQDRNPLQELSGLSCRWQPIKSTRGQIVTLLVFPTTQGSQGVLKKVLDDLNKIFDNDMSKTCPIRNNSLRYKSVTQCIRDEWKYNTDHTSKSFLHRFVTILICVWAYKWNLPIFFDKKNYKDSLESHSDYRKFDDILRMVIDCTSEEMGKIQDLLENLHNEGSICYGLHLSQESLMTCLVENIQQGGHIHFIDGGDGGYAMAAKDLKIQMRAMNSHPVDQLTKAIV